MYRLKSLKYLVTTGVITGLLITLAYVSQFIRIGPNQSILQLADGLFLGLIILIPGPMMLISGIIYVGIIDLITGLPVYIPISMAIRTLMFFITAFGYKFLTRYVVFILSSLMTYLYVIPAYFIFDPTVALAEVVNDSIQIVFAIVMAIIISLSLEKVNRRYQQRLWNDEEFLIYKKVKVRANKAVTLENKN
ncbi:hypothetical protein SSYRP_v1c07140 [Spiroplasma syrphidicola EA-1]|uniref:ECF transporter S component n=1 Tax=Spiroplasma syrphidicola EA-1 TaxID=1276229 RepID=R4UEE8_9MOLU|nr:hypothetical protein [Spiroplasma syrphidicola]AGM26304.1 hypothetical protein SSYRP_v1c07140 [Spiroplasma syrphidicola EA-1]